MRILRTALGELAALMGTGALGVSLAAQGGRFSALLDILTHFATVFLAVGLIALPLAAMAPRGALRIAAFLVSAAAVVAAAALMIPEYLRGYDVPTVQQNQASDTLKLIQFNVFARNRNPDAVVGWILAQNPDVVVVEEAVGIRDRLIKEGNFVATCLHCGAIVMTRSKPVASYVPSWRNRVGAYVTAATIADKRGEFTVIGLHRPWPTRIAENRKQTAEIVALTSRYARDRLIVAGDFNSTPWSFARRREEEGMGLIRRTRALLSWPAGKLSHNRLPAPFPYMPIDHVYAGPGWATVNVERGPKLGSDHYPVIVTLAPVSFGVR